MTAGSSDDATGSGGVGEPVGRLPLTYGQRNSVAALLRQVATSLETVERLLGARLDEPLRFLAPAAMPALERRARMLALANALAREANAMAELVGVSLAPPDVGRTLAGTFTVLWSDAEETSPERLRGYGPISPSAARALDPRVGEIARLSLALARAGEQESRAGGG
jgi:hypothetical protein